MTVGLGLYALDTRTEEIEAGRSQWSQDYPGQHSDFQGYIKSLHVYETIAIYNDQDKHNFSVLQTLLSKRKI